MPASIAEVATQCENAYTEFRSAQRRIEHIIGNDNDLSDTLRDMFIVAEEIHSPGAIIALRHILMETKNDGDYPASQYNHGAFVAYLNMKMIYVNTRNSMKHRFGL